MSTTDPLLRPWSLVERTKARRVSNINSGIVEWRRSAFTVVVGCGPEIRPAVGLDLLGCSSHDHRPPSSAEHYQEMISAKVQRSFNHYRRYVRLLVLDTFSMLILDCGFSSKCVGGGMDDRISDPPLVFDRIDPCSTCIECGSRDS
jgi:hypothetical protein